MAAVRDRWTGVRRGAGALCLSLAFVLPLGTAVAPPVLAAPAVITSPGPLTRIEISETLNCAVNHVSDAAGEFFGNTACGTFVAVGNKIYGPAVVPGATFLTTAPNYEAFTPISQTPVLGTGTAADPYRIITVVSADGLILTQTDSYVVGQESYRTDVTVTNNTATGPFTLYRAGDCFLQGSDQGFGSADPTTGSVACVGANPAVPNTPGSRIIQWRPITPGSQYIEALPSQVWAAIATGLPFPNICRCTELIDNAAGISWTATLPQGGAQAFSHITLFSPAGQQALTIAKTPDSPTVAPGALTSYTITITNPSTEFRVLNSLTDTLPPGFTYVAGSSTGFTTNNPVINGQTLTWLGPLVVAPGVNVFHFNVIAPTTPGTYFNTVHADGGAVTVVPTASTAQIVVSAQAATTTTTAVTTTTKAGGSGTTTTTAAGGGTATTTTTTASGGTTTTSTTGGGTTTTTTAAGGTTTTAAGSGGGGGGGGATTTAAGSGGGGAGGATTTTRNPLARTGSDTNQTASLAVGALTVGGILLLAAENPGPKPARRRPGSRRGTWSP